MIQQRGRVVLMPDARASGRLGADEDAFVEVEVLVRLHRTLFDWRLCGICRGMKPLFVRELSDPERHALQAGLRSSDGFTVRRCHILLASARGDTAPVIAQAVGCSPQAVRNVLRTAPDGLGDHGGGVPARGGKRMWQRRTVNPSDERSPTCKAWRSGSLNSRPKRGFIPQRDATSPPAKQCPLKRH